MSLARRDLLVALAGLAPWQLARAADREEALRHYAAERYRDAQDAFERLLEADPENSNFALWLGLSMGRRAERMTGVRRLGAFSLARKVLAMFERAVELDPENLAALEALQNFHLAAPGLVGGSKATARSLAGRIEVADTARGAAAWALYDEAVGEFDSALERHLQARERDPREMRYLLGHAAFLARRGANRESDALFDEAFSRDPDSPEAALAAAKAWIGAKRKDLYPRARQLINSYLDSPRRKPTSDPPSQVRKLLDKL